MSEFQTTFEGSDAVEILHATTALRWTFHVKIDRKGRRHLDGPNGQPEAMAHSDLMHHACTVARSEALHAGRVDY